MKTKTYPKSLLLLSLTAAAYPHAAMAATAGSGVAVPTLGATVLASAISNIIGQASGHPFDTIKTRM